MCCLDLETTAPEPEDARIVSATVAWVGGAVETEFFSVLVDPGVEIPEEAQAVHGLSTEHVREHGLDPAIALPSVLSALEAAQGAGYAVVAYNARYDLTVAHREAWRVAEGPSVALAGSGAWIDALFASLLVVDPLEVDHFLDRYRSGSRKLNDTCAHYGAPVRTTAEHEADHDAISAGRLAWCLGHHGRVVRRPPRSSAEGAEVRAIHEEWARVKDDLPALHEAQRRWAWDRAARLEDYFHQGNPAKDVPPQPDRVVAKEWPVIPVEPTAAASAAA